jgi:hypothetical protein
MGRPPKAPPDRRTERLSGIRCTVAERVAIEAKAAQSGHFVADYCRLAALRAEVVSRRTAAEDQLLSEANRIGVNLNQIAARVNFTGQLAEDFPAVLDELQALIDRLTEGGE